MADSPWSLDQKKRLPKVSIEGSLKAGRIMPGSEGKTLGKKKLPGKRIDKGVSKSGVIQRS